MNGAHVLYKPEQHTGSKPTPEISQHLAQLRALFVAEAIDWHRRGIKWRRRGGF